MSITLNKKEIEKFSRQIILKDIGSIGQRKIKQSKVLIVGVGGLGCPVAEFLVRAGVGNVGIVDNEGIIISTKTDPIIILEAKLEGKNASRQNQLIQQLNPIVGENFSD